MILPCEKINTLIYIDLIFIMMCNGVSFYGWGKLMSYYFQSKANQTLGGFFDNYTAHVQALYSNHLSLFHPKIQSELITKALINKLNVFTPLRDGHDYMDEIVGATLLPIAATIASILIAITAVKEAFHALAISSCLLDDDSPTGKDGHGTVALCFFALALFSALVAMFSIIKCAMSLITRPLATLEQCLMSQDQTSNSDNDIRFCYNK